MIVEIAIALLFFSLYDIHNDTFPIIRMVGSRRVGMLSFIESPAIAEKNVVISNRPKSAGRVNTLITV
ncbi:MAG: hypothetical protein ACI83O_000566 [Patescibacteria group bacterium]|jgi:hypothetical protein